MFSSFSTAAVTVSEFLGREGGGIAPDGSEPVGWLAGSFTLAFCIAGALVIWSFVRVSRKNTAMWAEREAAEREASADSVADDAVADGQDSASDL